MAEDQKNEVAVEEKTEDVVEEKTEDNIEETPKNTLPDLVGKIREEYEKRITEMEAKHASAIAERDAIIEQLISGNNSNNVSRETYISKINEKRNFKKW